MKKKKHTALQFFREIEKEQDKYKLVNDGFIVKYIDEEYCYFYGEFLKGGSANNPCKTNIVDIKPREILRYSKKQNIATTNLGVWRKLNISWNEKPISEILK